MDVVCLVYLILPCIVYTVISYRVGGVRISSLNRDVPMYVRRLRRKDGRVDLARRGALCLVLYRYLLLYLFSASIRCVLLRFDVDYCYPMCSTTPPRPDRTAARPQGRVRGLVIRSAQYDQNGLVTQYVPLEAQGHHRIICTMIESSSDS